MVSEDAHAEPSIKKPMPVFKNPEFQAKFRLVGTGKKKNWKSLKQILTQERTLPWPANAVTCLLTIVEP